MKIPNFESSCSSFLNKIPPYPLKFSSQAWDEWFAGLIDGDGCFYIAKNNEVSLEITTYTSDEKLLAQVKQKLGGAGSLKPRSGSNSVRYRVKQKETVRKILNLVNGKLHNKTRLSQFIKACDIFNIKPLPTQQLSKTSPYLAGLIDSDGTITCNVSSTTKELSTVSKIEGRIQRMIHSRGSNQISLKVASVDQENMQLLKDTYQIGVIYEVEADEKAKRKQKQYYWTLNNENDLMILYHCLGGFPLRSVKMFRIRLLPFYFKYKKAQYHLSDPGSAQFKQWEKFCRLWYKYGMKD